MRSRVGWIFVVSCLAARTTWAGALGVTASGEVQILDHVGMMGPLLGTATFDEGPAGAPVPLDAYVAQGMQLHTGPLVDILPGVIVTGNASAPVYADVAGPFTDPVWGGIASGVYARGGAVATFTAPVTQVGVIAGNESPQFFSIWDTKGEVIAEFQWNPTGDAQFLGIDTIGRPIGMIAFGDDQMAGSEPDPYTPLASAVASDTWVWSLGRLCETSADCDDGSMCTGDEVCQNGFCLFGIPLTCDDGDLCTTDICDPALGCGTEPINNCCHDDADCPQLGTVCEEAVCVLPQSETDGSTGTSAGESTVGESGDDTANATTGGTTGTSSGGSGGSGDASGSSDPGDTVTTTDDPDPPTSGPDATSTASTNGAGEVGSGGFPGETGSDGGCACDSRGGGGGLLVGLAVLLRRRRARR